MEKVLLFCLAVIVLCLTFLPILVSSELPAFVIGLVLLWLVIAVTGSAYLIAISIFNKENQK